MNHPHDWSEGNTLTLLENGEMFFPAVFADIRAAREEVILETFIWLDDAIGRAPPRRPRAGRRLQ